MFGNYFEDIIKYSARQLYVDAIISIDSQKMFNYSFPNNKCIPNIKVCILLILKMRFVNFHYSTELHSNRTPGVQEYFN